MKGCAFVLMLAVPTFALAVIIDRIAVVIGRSIVKDSDIDRDVRVTELLNGDPLDLSNAARKKAANRLIDQIFIRREIELADYPPATNKETEQQLNQLEKGRFKAPGFFEQALHRYGVAAIDIRTQVQWQLTILRFVDLRFRPAVLITDEEIDKYYRDHMAALRREYPGKGPDELRSQVRDILTGEKVNTQFFAWLDDQRKNNRVEFREESLR